MTRSSRFLVAAAKAVTMVLAAWPAIVPAAPAPAPAVLVGRVTSPAAQPLEGVIVTAARTGSTISTSVVSDRAGRYSFPTSTLAPGQYRLGIRAIGFDLGKPTEVMVHSGKTTTADLQLSRTAHLDDQMTNADWLISMPGTPQDKGHILTCTTCHTLTRIVTSRFTADNFKGLVGLMTSFASQASDYNPQRALSVPALLAQAYGGSQVAKLTDYLASINENATGRLKYPLRTMPRPTGRATRVIYTSYALPRREIQPHDVIVDRSGTVWFSEFGDQYLGRLNPRTGKVKEYPIPTLRPAEPKGALDLETDEQGHIWIAMMQQGGVAEFDSATGKFKVYQVPKRFRTIETQQAMVAPQHWEVDGWVWMNDPSVPGIYRVNVRTGRWQRFVISGSGSDSEYGFGAKKDAVVHGAYGVYTDDHNNLFFCDFLSRNIGEINARSGKISYFPTPTVHSMPRRGMMDDKDRLWFAEWMGNKLGEFDTKTHDLKEWPIPIPYFAPYQVVRDKYGYLWAGGMDTAQVIRMDPRTGKVIAYLLPGSTSTNIRHMFVDYSKTGRPILWIGSNHGASIIRMEPLGVE